MSVYLVISEECYKKNDTIKVFEDKESAEHYKALVLEQTDGMVEFTIVKKIIQTLDAASDDEDDESISEEESSEEIVYDDGSDEEDEGLSDDELSDDELEAKLLEEARRAKKEVVVVLDDDDKPEPLGAIEEEVLSFKYDLDCRVGENSKIVKAIQFNVSQVNVQTTKFETPVTQCEAVAIAEKFLAEPICKNYFAAVKDDMEEKGLDWADVKGLFETRGECLEGKTTITDVEMREDGTMVLHTSY